MSAKINLFVRVVSRRAEREDRKIEDIIEEYPALSDDEVDEILNQI